MKSCFSVESPTIHLLQPEISSSQQFLHRDRRATSRYAISGRKRRSGYRFSRFYQDLPASVFENFQSSIVTTIVSVEHDNKPAIRVTSKLLVCFEFFWEPLANELLGGSLSEGLNSRWSYSPSIFENSLHVPDKVKLCTGNNPKIPFATPIISFIFWACAFSLVPSSL